MGDRRIKLEDVMIVRDDATTRSGDDSSQDHILYTPVKSTSGEILGYYVGSSAFEADDKLNPYAAGDAHSSFIRFLDGPDDGTVALYDKDFNKIANLEVTSGFGPTTKIAFASTEPAKLGNVTKLPLQYTVSAHEVLDDICSANQIPVVLDANGQTRRFKNSKSSAESPTQILMGSLLPRHSRMEDIPLKEGDFSIGEDGQVTLINTEKSIIQHVSVTKAKEEKFVRSFFAARHNAELEQRQEPENVKWATIVSDTARSFEGRI
jgi:hypothetical protein